MWLPSGVCRLTLSYHLSEPQRRNRARVSLWRRLRLLRLRWRLRLRLRLLRLRWRLRLRLRLLRLRLLRLRLRLLRLRLLRLRLRLRLLRLRLRPRPPRQIPTRPMLRIPLLQRAGGAKLAPGIVPIGPDTFDGVLEVGGVDWPQCLRHNIVIGHAAIWLFFLYHGLQTRCAAERL